MGDLDSLVATVKDRMGNLIQRPKMTEKLLSKPPFRFLHDTITSITTTTGFGEGLYQGIELDSAAITDKQGKIDYLDKIFNLVGICKGAPIDVKAAKVVAGLEPENTNMFLLSLAECASDSSYDNAVAVKRVLAGEAPGQNPPPLSKVKAESKNERDDSVGSKGQIGGDDDGSKSGLEAKSRGDLEMLSERGKSRGGTRGGKPQTSSSDMGLHGSTAALNLDPEIERCDGTEATTQVLLGELITRPKLSEKLLSKPPFRFLHDIIMEIIKVTDFASGLYTAEEMDSALVTDKTQKLQFLEKIIKVVGIQLNTLVQAKPAKIVAGLDVQNTNNFLQLLAVCAKYAPESKSAVRTVLEQMGSEGGEMTTETVAPVQERNVAPKLVPKSEPKEDTIAGSKFDEKNEIVSDDNKQSNGDGDDGEIKRSARPTTARRRPPKVKDGAKEVVGRDVAPVTKKIEGILIDGQNDDDEELVSSETRLTDEMKADFKADKSKESKLVQDIRGRQAEQEAAIAPVKEPVDESDAANTKSSSGIRLGRLRKTGAEKKSTGANNSTISAPLSDGDIDKLRSAIQILVQHTGPLGTCMDYIQEDIGMMTAELHKWEDDCRKYDAEVEVEIRKSQETLHPLRMEQHDLDDQIAEQIAKISSIKAQIARNDDRIQQILKLVVNS